MSRNIEIFGKRINDKRVRSHVEEANQMTFTRPLCTPSGLIMMKVCSEAIDGETKKDTEKKEGVQEWKKERKHTEKKDERQ